AGIEGTREIFFAVIATTLALVAVFLPILFLGGLTGRLFREFGVTLAGAVIISSFVALTLTPMLSTKLLKQRAQQPWFYRKTEPFFRRMEESYRRTLETFMAKRWMALPVVGACLGLIVVFLNVLPQELAPKEDRGQVRISATAPEGATFEYMDAYMDDLVAAVQEEVPEIKAMISVTSPGFGASSSVNSGFSFLILADAAERDRTQTQIADAIQARANLLTGARTFVSEPASIGNRRGGLPVQY